MRYQDLVDKLMQKFTSGSCIQEVSEAKREFFDRAGMFDEKSEDFEMKMAQFTDWYLFTRPLRSRGLTPVQIAVGEATDLEALKLLENLTLGIHSLFEFLKSKNNEVLVRDLFSGQKYLLKASQVHLGLIVSRFLRRG